MSFKKIIHEVDKQGLDRSVAYTPKQLSEQGFMSPAISSKEEEVVVAEKKLTPKNALVELTEYEANSLHEVVEVVANASEKAESKDKKKDVVNKKPAEAKKKVAAKKVSKKVKAEIKEIAETMDVT